jgi:hypothetical protein
MHIPSDGLPCHMGKFGPLLRKFTRSRLKCFVTDKGSCTPAIMGARAHEEKSAVGAPARAGPIEIGAGGAE